MFVAIALLALHQSPSLFQPILSIGASPVLTKAVQDVAKLTSSGDFAGAKKSLRLLPDYEVKISWDESSIPKDSRFDFRAQQAQVFAEWIRSVPSARFTLVDKNPDLLVSFVSGSGVNLKWSSEVAEARLTLKIGLSPNGVPIDPNGVHNAFSYGIGIYFGIAKLPIPALLMSAPDDPAPLPLRLSPLESSIANSNLKICSQIREQVQKSSVIRDGMPALATEPKPVDLGTVLQGTKADFEFHVPNSGSAPLVFRVIPDCTCFSVVPTVKLVQPNSSGKAILRMDTTQFAGSLHKTLYLFTNDSQNPVRAIPIDVRITPRYRMLPPRPVLIADEDGITLTAYLFTPKDHPLKIKQAQSEGLPGEVAFEPWQGDLADPDMNEGALPRTGYRFVLRLRDIPEGSQLGTNIVVTTDDPTFEQINYTLFVQRGILAMPANVFMGEIGASPRKMAFLVTRPGKPFKISAIEVDSSHLSATFEPTKTVGEYRVSVNYDGKAAQGDYRASVSVKTDDPKQPVIVVPVTATVR
jgi:hypothetical protein